MKTHPWRAPIAALGAMLAAMLLVLVTVAGQARAADPYTVEPFSGCSEGSSSVENAASGSWDDAGRLYIPCGSPSTIRVYDSEGVLQRSIQPGFTVSDVAPSPDGSVLYAARGASEPVRLVRQQDGSYTVDQDWTLASYVSPVNQQSVRPHGLFISTDGSGNIYLADGQWAGGARGEVHTVIKYAPDGTLLTRFGQKQAGSWSDGIFNHSLTGLVASRDGSRVYTTENGNNRVQRWDRQANGSYSFHSRFGGTAETDPNRTGGPDDKQCGAWAINPTFAAPYDVGIDGTGNVYVLNTSCRQVLKFVDNDNGTYSLSSQVSLRNQDGSLPVPPHGFTVAQNGNVYVGQAGKKMVLPGDNVAPTVTSVAPQAGATGVSASANVSADFSEAMNASTISASTFTLKKQGTTTALPATVTYDSTSKRATLTPDSDLEAGAGYTATLKGGTGGVKDAAGNALAQDKVWSFTVASSTAFTCDKWASTGGNDATGTGTQAAPYLRIATLIRNLDPGETGCLKAGETFEEPSGEFQIENAGGTQGNPITIRSSGTPHAKIKAQVHLKPTSHDIVFRDLSFVDSYVKKWDGTPLLAPDRSTMLIVEGDRISFQDNDITFERGHCLNVGHLDGQTGVPVDPAEDFVLDGNRIHNCGSALANFSESGEHGVYLKYTLRASVTNNYIYDNKVRGLQIYPRAEDTVVQHNVLDGNSGNLNIGSYPEADAFSRGTSVKDNIITNSTFLGPDDTDQVYGFYPAGTTDSQYNNVVTQNCFFPVYGGEQEPPDVEGNFGGEGFSHFDNDFVDPLYENRDEKDFDIPATSPCAGKGPQTDGDGNQNTAPTITAPTPANGTATSDTTPDITATVSDAQTELVEDNIDLYINGRQLGHLEYGYNQTTDTLFHTPEQPLPQDDYTIRVVATDAQGLPAERIWSFEVDTSPPEIVSFGPTGRRVSAKVNVTATFSDAMDPETLDGTTFKLVRKGTTASVLTTVTYSSASQKAILDPARRLKAGATYTATVTTGAKDVAGNALAAGKVWSFKIRT